MCSRCYSAWALLATCLMGPRLALANPYDISLRGLGRPQNSSLSDPAVVRFRGLSSELALALSPRPLSPAETLGMDGFEFSVVSTSAGISATKDYWQGQPGIPVFEGVLPNHGSRKVPSSLWIPNLHIRKGLPLSTELGINCSYLAQSDMFMLGAEAKIALHESYFRWVPALAFRGAAARLLGAADIDMFTFEFDALTSLPFGVGGMATVTPYLGGGIMFAHTNSTVIDETPYNVLSASDQKGGRTGSLYTFPTLSWDQNQHIRILVGLRVNIAMLEFLYEFDYGIIRWAGNRQLSSHSVKIGFDV